MSLPPRFPSARLFPSVGLALLLTAAGCAQGAATGDTGSGGSGDTGGSTGSGAKNNQTAGEKDRDHKTERPETLLTPHFPSGSDHHSDHQIQVRLNLTHEL